MILHSLRAHDKQHFVLLVRWYVVFFLLCLVARALQQHPHTRTQVHSVDRIMDGQTKSAFCLVRPPGHHAGPSGLEGAPSCGFCIFNSIAIGAAHALRVYGYRQNEQDRACKRVAILDFDIHHGNGTEAIVKRLAKQYPNQIFFCSIHLYDKSSTSRYSFYPGTFKLVTQIFSRGDISVDQIHNISKYTGTGKNDHMPSNVVNIALPPMWHNESLSSSPDGLHPPQPVGRRAFRKEIMSRLVPSLRAFSPDLIMISAGFDGGRGDIGNQKLGSSILQQGMDLNVQDYSWLTEKIRNVAKVCCDGRIISVCGWCSSTKRETFNHGFNYISLECT